MCNCLGKYEKVKNINIQIENTKYTQNIQSKSNQTKNKTSENIIQINTANIILLRNHLYIYII